ncbi:peptidoglycan-binding protein [Yinghuangia sp. YIM S09857]|uniref:peptidoglycan-binding protein n=1 Tax=Yinghuangia sp. YIM S09857 TaxID=3436929 RepID=UPI003F53C1F7
MSARRRVRAGIAVTGVVLGAGAIGAVATGSIGGGEDPGTPAAAAGPPATATVQRTTLTRTQTVAGTLGYGTPSTVEHPQPGGGAAQTAVPGGPAGGTVTWLPEAGAAVARGQSAYAVDGRPVPLLYGTAPLYRTLSAGTEGPDVEMLEANLVALGYTGFTADDTYTSATATATRAWQDDLGRAETGTVAPGEAVVAPGERRVAERKTEAGRAAPGPVLTWTGTERTVAVALEVRYEDLVGYDAKAVVELPDGTSVEARVTQVGVAASAPPQTGGPDAAGAPQPPAVGDATVPVTLAVADQAKLGKYQAAPVSVQLVAEVRENVLAVPVNALVALREGGYAVEAVGPAGTEYRPVSLGIFVGGNVEVSGPGITQGLVVGVPR